jgi:exonuclease SbcD
LTANGNNNVPVVYSGSLERVDFGEENDTKGFIWVEINDVNDVCYEFVEVDARPYKTIRMDLTGGIKRPTEKILEKISNTGLMAYVVRVIIDIDDADADRIRQEAIYDALKKARVYVVHSLQIKRAAHERVQRLQTDKPIASLTQLELLDAYFESDEITGKRKASLINLAKDIMSGG